jgi:hypothetical protein
MKTLMMLAALAAAAAANAAPKAAPKAAPVLTGQECSGRELKPGTVLDDGTVAGEKETLDYLQAKEPELFKKVSALPRKELRQRFPEQLMWFQRVGPCRQRQKAESVRQLKSELAADGMAEDYKKTADLDKKAALEKQLRGLLGERFDSEMAGMEVEAGNLEEAVREFEEEAALIREKMAVRKKSRDLIIDKRLKELVGG